MESHEVTALFIAVTAVVVVILVLWVFPGYLSPSPNCPTRLTAGARAYCAESVGLVGNCHGPEYCPAHATFTFHGVSFFLTLEDGTGGPVVRGDVGEGTSTFYQVDLPGNSAGPPSANWTSPDRVTLIEWQAPFATVESNGELTANVTCGVDFAVPTGT
jgi:hypothetical protein